MPRKIPFFSRFDSVLQPAIWILCLAAVSVGLLNTENGMSPDSRIYATIARNIARSGDWFLLQTDIPEYHPYFSDHPHWMFWLVAIVFKFLPPADWSARIVGHLYYVFALGLIFWFVRRVYDKRVAVFTILILWSWYIFSNTFSSVMTDPSLLFWGMAALFFQFIALHENKWSFALASGVCLTLSAMSKGMAFAGFVPPLVVLTLHSMWTQKKVSNAVLASLLHVVAFAGVLGLYIAAVKSSSVPDYIDRYFHRQLANRIGPQFSLTGLLDKYLWGRVFAYLYWIWPAIFYVYAKAPKEKGRVLAMTAFLTFLVLLAGAGLTAPHNYILLMPWAAMLLGIFLAEKLPGRTEDWVRYTTVLALFVVVVAQYFPFSVHGNKPTTAQLEIGRLKRKNIVDILIRDVPEMPLNFLDSSVYAWYGDVKIEMPDDKAWARPRVAYYLHSSGYDKRESLKRRGWCLHQAYFNGETYLHCTQIETARVY